MKFPATPYSCKSSPIIPCLIVIGLVALVLSLYMQTGDFSYIGLDDPQYVYNNPFVMRGITIDGTQWAFTTSYAANWHPLTWLSHMVDVELFGISPGWHHRVNVLFHILNTTLLFIVLWQTTGRIWQSGFVAALFGVHPLHVESVAWVSSRKDVLSAMFWILTIGAYLRYVHQPNIRRYLPVVLSFGLGLMCKPMLVTLPFVLLLMDWWPLGRASPDVPPASVGFRSYVPGISRLIKEKLPLIFLSILSCFITLLVQAKGGAVRTFENIPLDSRISNALVSYMVYLIKSIWPWSLAVFYPHPLDVYGGIPIWKVAFSLLMLSGITFLVLRQRYRKPYLGVGWFWYVGTLIPVIGLVQVGNQSMADRYTYIPLVGIFIAVVWGVYEMVARRRVLRVGLVSLGGVVVLAYSVAAWNQAGYWRDSFTIFSRALAVTEKNWLAWNSLGVTYAKLGDFQHAIPCYQESLRINPESPKTLTNLGVAYYELGHPHQAINYYKEALRIAPDSVDAWNALGASYDRIGQIQQAIDSYREALRITPEYADAWFNLGVIFQKIGQTDQAIIFYREAVKYRPDYADGWYYLGINYKKTAQIPQAIACFEEALRIRPNFTEARDQILDVYGIAGKVQ